MNAKHTPGTIEALPYPMDCGKENEGRWWLKGCPDADGWTSIAKLSRRTGDGESGETAANAKRLALCWNMHDELVEVLRALLKAEDSILNDSDCPGQVKLYLCSKFKSDKARSVLAKLERGAK